jgi:hypothetical protein
MNTIKNEYVKDKYRDKISHGSQLDTASKGRAACCSSRNNEIFEKSSSLVKLFRNKNGEE